eukprot:TRINITY_DN6607_c0_g1_i1.p1 TRINITY_DN6607_c0_g1~~TRINITY_DN6607_c0_g1_i1.p1  ORF type:complete len:405 (+),score=124.66 TRINITY_DN6607_c0_g1_i1:71-1285(+)
MEPSNVASFFVRSYYTTLSDNPTELWRFYQDDSQYTYNEEPESGLENIRARISRLDFKDCKVNVTSVDSQQSVDSSVVISVVGLISNKSTPFRDFVQLFVLAPQQPKGFYVRNDVFRHLSTKKVEAEAEAPVVAAPAPVAAPIAQAAPKKPAVSDKPAAPVQPAAPAPTATATAPQATAPAQQTTTAAPVAKKEKPASWAGVVKTAPATTTEKPARKQQTKPAAPATATAATDSASPAAAPAEDELAGVEGGHWVFVSKLSPEVTADQLRVALGSFGEITNVDIKKRSFQFVQFASAEGAAKACAAGFAMIGQEKATIEKRQQSKSRGTRGPRTERKQDKPRKEETAAAPTADASGEGEFRTQRKPRAPRDAPRDDSREHRREPREQRDRSDRPPRRQQAQQSN